MWAQAVCEIIGYNVFNGAVASGGFQLSGAAAFLIDDLPPHARDFSHELGDKIVNARFAFFGNSVLDFSDFGFGAL